MGEQIKVDPAWLAQPANRFKAGGSSLTQMSQVLRTVLQGAGQAAQHPVVVTAADTFGQATAAVLGAFAEDCQQMSGKLTAAGFVYHVTDETALVVQLDSLGLQPAEPKK
ncbi:MAG TPA: hypothetical protein VMU51_26445 [Mycobacteriales bacterium]|nr:hypothetical protein [Mycobacteriales bacterium]